MNSCKKEKKNSLSPEVNFEFDLEESEVLLNIVNPGGETARFSISGREKECYCGEENVVEKTRGVLGTLYIEDTGGDSYFEEIVSIIRFSNNQPIPEYHFSITPGHRQSIRIPITNRKDNTRDKKREHYNFVDYSDFDLHSCDEVRIEFRFECESLPEGFRRKYSEVIDVNKLLRENISDKI